MTKSNRSISDRMAVGPGNPQGVNDGSSATTKYLTGYVIEKSLSVDNIFVIAMVFSVLAVPAMYQHRVLFWGIVGALLMRGVMIGVGAALIERFDFVIYVFGGFLILTGLKMLVMKAESLRPGDSVVVLLAKRLWPVTDGFHGKHFFVRAGSEASRQAATPGAAAVPDAAVERAAGGVLMMTPLFLALLLVEFTDLIFAVDSIPAIFAITTDPFLVFTSNVFAILGLRSLYFALAGMMEKFRYLKVSLAAILVLVGVKMILHAPLKAVLGAGFNFWLLGMIAVILLAGVGASWWVGRRRGEMAAVERV